MRGRTSFSWGLGGMRLARSMGVRGRLIDYELLRAEAARHPYKLLFATVSGAHLYGIPSPDSDKMRAHPARGGGVGLLPKEETVETERPRGGIEMDLVTHDILKFFTMPLKRNGYVMEQLYSPLIVETNALHEELKEIARGCLQNGRLTG